MYFHGMFTSQQFQDCRRGRPGRPRLLPVSRISGPQYDAEKALDAPIDGFMLSKAPKNLDAAKAFLEYLAPARDAGHLGYQPTRAISPRRRTPTPAATAPLQKKAPRSSAAPSGSPSSSTATRTPNFAGPNGMQAFLLDFLQNPDQDLAGLQKKIQDFWDTL